MRYLVILADGMADYPLAELDGKTPLEAAHTPHMDLLAQEGYVGLVNTIPEGMKPGSDVANLSLLGYDPAKVYTGRGPLEAANMGVKLAPEDVAFRCNLVTLGEEPDPIMIDFTADHIESGEAKALIDSLNHDLKDGPYEFYPGVSYRHLFVWRGGEDQMETTPPHDITGRGTRTYLPKGPGAESLIEVMMRAKDILAQHPMNVKRMGEKKRPANAIWLWGQGRAPRIQKITEKYGIKGGVISAVDLLNGIGFYAGLEIIKVPGITGYIDTNFRGKASYAIEALERMDFVFIHVEAPDEMGHEGNIEGKIEALEKIDQEIIGYILSQVKAIHPVRILLAGDHPTPIALKTHAPDPSPFVLWSSIPEERAYAGVDFSEKNAEKRGVFISPGYKLLEMLFNWRKGQ